MKEDVGSKLMILVNSISKLLLVQKTNKEDTLVSIDKLASRMVTHELKKIMLHSIWKDKKRRAK